MQAAANGRCAECGEALPSDAGACPACGAQLEELSRRPRGTFAILLGLLVIGFVITGIVVRGFEARRQQLAERWYGRGDRDLQRGAALQSINEFQTALAYSRDNDLYRLKLALALMQAGKWEEARAHLLNLWERRPGDGNVNLLLARVFAHRNLPANAIRYYHGAIYGVWDNEPIENRERARFELADYLLSSGQEQAAQSELIALASELPTSTAEQLRLARLMLQANEPQRALDIFERVRRKERNSFDATLGAAQASFALQHFANARELAREALRVNSGSKDASELVEQADAIVKADPRVRGLSTRDRAQRAYTAYKVADARLSSCADDRPADASLQQLVTDQNSNFSRLRETALRDQDLRDQVVRWVFDVETAAAKSCGAPTGNDATLFKLAQAQEKER